MTDVGDQAGHFLISLVLCFRHVMYNSGLAEFQNVVDSKPGSRFQNSFKYNFGCPKDSA